MNNKVDENLDIDLESLEIEKQISKAINESSIIVKTDLSGKITYANENFCNLSQYSEKELIGSDHKILNSGFHDKVFFKHLWETVLSGKKWNGEIKNRAKDGSFYWTYSNIFPILGKNDEVLEFLVIRKDITSIKNNFQSLIIDEKLRSIGESTAQLLHDIITPLTVIKLSSTRALKNLKNGTEIDLESSFDKILLSSEKIEGMFNEVRTKLTKEAKSEVIVLEDLIFESVKELGSGIEQNKIELCFSPSEKTNIVGSKLQLGRVITNLIKNATEAVMDDEVKNKWIKVTVTNSSFKSKICVSDSGLGIPLNIQDKIWNNLFTTKEELGGTGLGLASCRQIIRAHGGDIFLDTQNEHTQFVIELNLAH